MPQISFFYGIYIWMNFADHQPPHFHAWYGDYKVIVNIKDGIVKGEMPGRALRMVLEWLEYHRKELMENWEKAQKGEPLEKIEPLNKNNMFIEIVKAEYVDGYKVKLLFNNGETKIVDLASSLNGIVFAPLKDIEFFKRFTIKFNTIEWENGADFAPEYLYEIGTIYEEGNMILEEENMNPHVITTEKIVHTIKDSHQKTKIEPSQIDNDILKGKKINKLESLINTFSFQNGQRVFKATWAADDEFVLVDARIIYLGEDIVMPSKYDDDEEGIIQFRKDIQTDLTNGSIQLFGFSLPILDLTNGECNKITNQFNNSSLFYFARVYGENTIHIKKLKDDFQTFMETGYYKFNYF